MDPIKDGVNWYVYAANNPLKYVDKNGLEPNFFDNFYSLFINPYVTDMQLKAMDPFGTSSEVQSLKITNNLDLYMADQGLDVMEKAMIASAVFCGTAVFAATILEGVLATTSLGVSANSVTATGGTTVVLGKAPYYLQKAAEIGGKAFNVSKRLLNNMPKYADKIWQMNKTFIDKAIEKGYSFLLSSNPANAEPGSGFAQEIEYLQSLGYQIVEKVVDGVTTYWME